jgi:hypothetical protein
MSIPRDVLIHAMLSVTLPQWSNVCATIDALKAHASPLLAFAGNMQKRCTCTDTSQLFHKNMTWEPNVLPASKCLASAVASRAAP